MSDAERKEQLALERRLAELRPCEVIRRSARGAIVRLPTGEFILLDGGRLARDPKHKGHFLLGGDLTLRAEMPD
jgi:hypothetical protein